jgi:hypothetical protein
MDRRLPKMVHRVQGQRKQSLSSGALRWQDGGQVPYQLKANLDNRNVSQEQVG